MFVGWCGVGWNIKIAETQNPAYHAYNKQSRRRQKYEYMAFMGVNDRFFKTI
jgi:hypothetical protein